MPKLKRPTIQIPIDTDKLMVKALRLHQYLYERSGGRIGANIGGVHCLLLRTTGRKSGLQRTAALGYAKDGEDYVLVASNNGSDASPQWLENIRKHPQVEIQVGPVTEVAEATIIERGGRDYERLLRLANANTNWRYFHYQQRTSRPIPVVVVRAESAPDEATHTA